MPRAFDVLCPAPLSAQGFEFRPAEHADEAALRDLYVRHRWDEFAPLGLPETQIRALLSSQYSMQSSQFAACYANPRFFLLARQGAVAARLMLGEAEGTVRILDILVEPALRGRGIGGSLLVGLLEQAGAAGRQVSLHVAKGNPALRLYERLGFKATGDVGIAFSMLWSPFAPATGPAHHSVSADR